LIPDQKVVEMENSAKYLFCILIIVASLAALSWGVLQSLKILAPILIPVTLIYIASVVIRLPYDFIKRHIDSPFVSFWTVIAAMTLFAWLILKSIVGEFIIQYSHLKEYFNNNWGTIDQLLKEKVPLIKDLIEKLGLKDQLSALFNSDTLITSLDLSRKTIEFIGGSTFSLLMAVITWVVIPSFIYAIVTRPLNRRHIYSIIPMASRATKLFFVKVVFEFRSKMEIYFTRQLFISVSQIVLLFTAFKLCGFNSSLALAVIFGALNLIPNLGTLLLLIASPVIGILFDISDHYSYGVMLSLAIGMLLLLIDNLLFPRLIEYCSRWVTIWREELHMHPALITLAIIFWGYLLDGVFGLVLSIPITILMQVLISKFRLENSDTAVQTDASHKERGQP